VLVAICFFLSGAAALILQVLWTRMLGHVFGATALAISTTLSVFMAGLALGSHFGGKLAPKLKNPLLAFAALETSVGLYGLLVPTLLSLMGPIQAALALDLGDSIWGYAMLRFILVALILIVPTTAMGATLPILAEGVVKKSEQLAGKTGLLYASNTFGAVAGSFVAGFVLIPRLGITATVYLAAAIDLFVALTVLGLFKLAGESLLLRSRDVQTPDDRLRELEPPEMQPIAPLQRKLTLVVFAISGGAAMALEVLWSRAIGMTIGASTYSFTLILTTFLVGLAVGAHVVSRRVDRISDPIRWLAWTEVAVGGCAAVASMFIDKLPLWLHATARTHGITMGHIYVTNFLIIAAITLPSTLALGGVMPLVMRVLAPKGIAHAGPLVGRAYAINTVGAIAGSFAGGFLILPLIGVEDGLSLAAFISVSLGVLLAMTLLQDRRNVLVAALLATLVVLFAPSWDMRSWTSGLFRMYLAKSVYARGWAPSGKVLFHRDGIASSVTVDQSEPTLSVSLKVNGKTDASDIGDMPTQVLSGLLPIFLHPGEPKEVLVIGYGSGVTPGAVLRAPIAHLDVAEIESAVYEAANRFFTHVNGKPFEDPRTRLVVDDGRNFLLTRNKVYDVIISEPSNPWMTGAASLFTNDFFQVAEHRLAEDGIFLQWLQLYELAPENIHALLRTFSSVFEYVLVFTPDTRSNDTLLIGSRHPVKIDRDRVAKYFATPAMQAELKRAKVKGPEDFFGLFLLGDDQLEEFVGQGPLNTDDNALIEFRAPKDLLTYATADPRLPFLDAMDGKRFEQASKYFSSFPLDAPSMADIGLRLLEQGRIDDAEIFLTKASQGGAEVDRWMRVIDYVREDDDQPVVIANDTTKGDERYARVAYTMMQGNDKDALAIFEMNDKLEDVSLAHRFLYAFLCYRQARFEDAEYLMEKIIADPEFMEKYPPTVYYAGKFALYRDKYEEAVIWLARFADTEAKTSTTAVN
jgi:spermidine synthase